MGVGQHPCQGECGEQGAVPVGADNPVTVFDLVPSPGPRSSEFGIWLRESQVLRHRLLIVNEHHL
jgi:hypothetical protein